MASKQAIEHILNVFSNYLLNLGETFKEFMEKNGKKVLC
jgi:hypothetical protein